MGCDGFVAYYSWSFSRISATLTPWPSGHTSPIMMIILFVLVDHFISLTLIDPFAFIKVRVWIRTLAIFLGVDEEMVLRVVRVGPGFK